MTVGKVYIFVLCLHFSCIAMMYGQEPSIPIEKTKETIIIDGKLDESIWQNKLEISNFQMTYPSDSLQAISQTKVGITFDDKNIYIAAIAYNALPRSYVAQSLKRDFDFLDNDAFAIIIDPYDNANSGFCFAINPFAVQMDGIIGRGGEKGISKSWDGLWSAETYRDSQQKFWTLEIAIPFKTLRYKENLETWRINFIRNDLNGNEVSSWFPIPRGFEFATLSRTGKLKWNSPIQKQGSNIVVVPYVASHKAVDYQTKNNNTNSNSIGLDARIPFNSSLNLDLTINSDFSQVEVDQQVIDLNRFELFFPEKRLFFLENSDLFSNLGNSRLRPYFSRRIGSAGSEPIPIVFGVKLSGNLNNGWRIGMMTVQTKASEEWNNEGQNYTVATIQKSVFHGSNITVFISNRQAFDDYYALNNFNRIGGLEFNYRSANSKIRGKAFLHRSFIQENLQDALGYSAKIRYKDKRATIFLGLDAAGENYITDIGFAPRLYHEDNLNDSIYRVAYKQIRTNGYYRFFWKENNLVDFFSPLAKLNVYTDSYFKYTEHDLELSLLLRFMDQGELKFTFLDYSPVLFFPFTLSGLDKSFPAGNYPNQGYSLKYESSKRKNIFGKTFISYGGEYMGKRLKIIGELNYRLKQKIALGGVFTYQNLHEFPDNYGEAEFYLIGSKLEISFHRNLFFTSFIQYNTQSDNFNINGRFNWRFKPMSDLFLVYTENYFAENIGIKNRALVLKINYWFNL